MDPRRVPELSLAAARGAARKAASDARQSSIRQAIMQARGISRLAGHNQTGVALHTDRDLKVCSAWYRSFFRA